jgi:ribosomal protein S18 acetylase RimI-like enzyme
MQTGYHYFGARLEGKIVGFYKTYLKPEGLLGEHQTVHPDFRHRGLVRAMYRQFIAYASELKAPANLCNILYKHNTMRELVEGFGFQPEDEPYEQAPGMLVQLYKRPTTL